MFGQRDGLLPLAIFLRRTSARRSTGINRTTNLVEVGGQPTELEQFVLLQLASQLDVVEVVKAVDRVPQCLVVFLLNQQVVVCIIDSLDVEL